jgi:hypothetical protein
MALFSALQRKVLTSVTLGCWLFAFFVGVVHACVLNGELGHSQQVVSISIDSQGLDDHDAHPGCEQFCAENVPVLAQASSVAGQSGEQALLPSPPRWCVSRWVSTASPAVAMHRPHPPPGVALNTRFVRLAL